MNNIAHIHNCFGCGVCVITCPKKIIELNQNKDGFYTPDIIDKSKCINCGLCKDVCSFSHKDLAIEANVIKSYAAWSNDLKIRQKCSSGGVSYELCKKAIENNFFVCAVRYAINKQRAEHYIAKDILELEPSIGSKYIQSYTVEGFKQLKRGNKYLIVGTPCQIDSLRRYIRKNKIKDNFILIDFFCHSVPSMLMWGKYINAIEKKLGTIKSVTWRNKMTGWHDSWAMNVNDSYRSRLSTGDKFYKLFLGDFCINDACKINCKYKYNKSSADIRIGDLWGNTYAADENGVSAVAVFTQNGLNLLKQTDCVLIEHPFEIVAEGQMRQNVSKAYTAPIAKILLKQKNISLDSPVWEFLIFIEKVMHYALKMIHKKK